MATEWKETKLIDFMDFNPVLSIKKNSKAKKVPMEKLLPFTRKINGYEVTEYKGGSKFQNGDTLLARITPCLENGKTAFVSILEEGETAFGSTEFIVLRAKKNVSDPFFIYYLMRSPFIREIAVKSMIGSSGRQRVQQDVLENLEICLPSLEAQRKISKILSSLDEKIELNNKINENLHAQTQAIFKSWFVNFESFKNEKYSDSVLGKIPSKFTVVNLESLCSVITKGTTPTTIKRNFMPCGVNFLKVETILENHDFDKTKFTFIDNETNELMSRSKIKENDILLSMAGTIGRFAIVRNDLLPANINQALAIIRADETKISSYCLYSYFLGGWHTNFYLKKIQQAVQANLSLTSIKSLPILLPNREILQAYEKVIIPIIEKIKNIQVENIKLAQIRDTLLPKLMSGELEV